VILGRMSLVYYERWISGRRPTHLVGPGAAAADEYTRLSWLTRLSPGHRLALLIATGIGVHNFGEGLAIGQSAAAGEMQLALVLIIGFGLHNATEGFGIIGPMTGEGNRPSWAFLILLGLIGGGPTFLGTVVGQAWVSEGLAVAFFAIAAGSILFVVQELFEVNRKFNVPILVTWMVLAGLALGFATDFVLEAAGG
jgi:zinc transporter, ZIP family